MNKIRSYIGQLGDLFKKSISSISTLIYVYSEYFQILVVCFFLFLIIILFSFNALTTLIIVIIVILALINLRAYIQRERFLIHKTSAINLVLNFRGPILKSTRKYIFIGDRLLNRSFFVEVMIQNIGTQPSKKVALLMNYPKNIIKLELKGETNYNLLKPGDVKTIRLHIQPIKKTEKQSEIKVQLLSNGGIIKQKIIIKSVFSKEKIKIRTARIDRWKYGALAAFVWRGDLDNFAPGMGQDENGLSVSLELSKRYGIPISLFISGRLTLNYDDWNEWVHHFYPSIRDISRNRFLSFVNFLRDIEFNDNLEYPVISKKYFAQLGNHMYLHYGTCAGACNENCWNRHVTPDMGMDAWIELPRTAKHSLMYYNCVKNQHILQEIGETAPLTWAAPRNLSCSNMAKELEHAGIIGTSEADIYKRPFRKWIFPRLPKFGVCLPYHPPGCDMLVETKAFIYPDDPRNVHDVICIKKGIKHAVAKKKQVTLLVHPHLRIHTINPCLPYFSEILRHLVQEQGSMVWMPTHALLVKYWEDIRCPKHRVISIHLSKDGKSLVCKNASSKKEEGIPITLEFSRGKKCLEIVNLGPSEEVPIDLLK